MQFKKAFRAWLLKKLHAVCMYEHLEVLARECSAEYDRGFTEGHSDGVNTGLAEGEKRAKLKLAVLPLPFTAEQLAGRQYGEFITPVGFGTALGECTVPAPGPHGYEQRAYYVSKRELDGRASGSDMRCHSPQKFNDPANSEELVPVIVTVLR